MGMAPVLGKGQGEQHLHRMRHDHQQAAITMVPYAESDGGRQMRLREWQNRETQQQQQQVRW